MQQTHTFVGEAVFSSSAGGWLKSDETVAMKTKRADFAAAFLRGRMIVAGGLGERAKLYVYCIDICCILYLSYYSCWDQYDKLGFSPCSKEEFQKMQTEDQTAFDYKFDDQDFYQK